MIRSTGLRNKVSVTPMAPGEIRKNSRTNLYRAKSKHGQTKAFSDYASASTFALGEEVQVDESIIGIYSHPTKGRHFLRKEKGTDGKSCNYFVSRANTKSRLSDKKFHDVPLDTATTWLKDNDYKPDVMSEEVATLLREGNDPMGPNPAGGENPVGPENSVASQNSTTPGDGDAQGNDFLSSLEAVAIGAAELFDALNQASDLPSWAADQAGQAKRTIENLSRALADKVKDGIEAKKKAGQDEGEGDPEGDEGDDKNSNGKPPSGVSESWKTGATLGATTGANFGAVAGPLGAAAGGLIGGAIGAGIEHFAAKAKDRKVTPPPAGSDDQAAARRRALMGRIAAAALSKNKASGVSEGWVAGKPMAIGRLGSMRIVSTSVADLAKDLNHQGELERKTALHALRYRAENASTEKERAEAKAALSSHESEG